MEEGSVTSITQEEAKSQLREERRAILEQFAKLSGREQELQRRSWADELSKLLDEVNIFHIKW